MLQKRRFRKYRFFVLAISVMVTMDCALVKAIRSTFEGSVSLSQKSVSVESELEYFPVAACKSGKLTVNFVDSWEAERNFGGERTHEGCDIITSENQRGIYPVVSMTDGTVEKLGWLMLGGYRIGIRSPGGNYYYYAHMESYAENLAVGDEVSAGEFLGFVGDSGYGDEGTTGQFVVHLHVGIYVPDANGEDTAVNPYPYLKNLQDSTIMAEYKMPM